MRYLISLTSLICSIRLLAQDPSIHVSDSLPGDANLGKYIGHNESYYFALRIEEEDGDRIGYIDARSKNDLTLVHGFQLSVPVENAENFTVEEIIFGEKELLMFYSFFSKEDDKRTLAVSTLDGVTGEVGAAQKIHSESGRKDEDTGKYTIKHEDGSGLTTILVTHPSKYQGYVIGDFEVIHMDEHINVVHSGRGQLAESSKIILSDVFFTREGDVYFILIGGNVVSYDHRTGLTKALKVPPLSKEQEKIYYDRDPAFFTEAPDGTVYLFNYLALRKFDGIDMAGFHVFTFDASDCSYKGDVVSEIKTRDVYTDRDKDAKYHPSLYYMRIVRRWWTTSGTMMIGLQRSRLKGVTTYMEHTAMTSWSPNEGIGEVFFNYQPQVLSTTQTNVGGTMFVPADDEAYLVFMDHKANSGLDNGSNLKVWTPQEADTDGLVPMVVHFDGASFGLREPVWDLPSIPPYQTYSWMSNSQEQVSILRLWESKEQRLIRVGAQ